MSVNFAIVLDYSIAFYSGLSKIYLDCFTNLIRLVYNSSVISTEFDLRINGKMKHCG
jgi:hypothetical protein